MAENNTTKKPNAIMFSAPFDSHLNSTVSLALQIASKGIKVTFVQIESFVNGASKGQRNGNGTGGQVDLFSDARKSGLDIQSVTIKDGFRYEVGGEPDYQIQFWTFLYRDFPARVDEFVGKLIQSDPSSAYFLLTDTIYPWPAAVAKKHNLVYVSFWTVSALTFTLAYHREVMRENGHIPRSANDIHEEIKCIPGVSSLSTRDLMCYLTKEDTKTFFMAFDEVKKADFILLNTIDELESDTIAALNKYQPTYAIGIINYSKKATIRKSLLSESDCGHWLDSKPPGSVLYISFGSIVPITKQVIEEIAFGLLLSDVNFIWVVRPGATGSDDANVLPIGFEDQVKDKGLIIPWCNQIAVLSHPTIGGFFTHGGWSSAFESIWCGVPMLVYPVMYDQLTHRKLLVDDWKVGIEISDGKPSDRNRIAEEIKSFMSDNILKGIREEATKLKSIAQNALDIDGSSERNFNRFVKDLENKISHMSATE